MLEKQGAVHDVETQQEEIEEEAEAQEELSSWCILLTRSMPHRVSKRTKSLRPGDYSLMIQSFVTSSVTQKLKQPGQANRTGHLPLENWMHL